MELKATNIPNCISRGKSIEYDCRNHIRVIQPIGDGSRLYICGTNAHSPKDEVIYANLTHLARHEFYPGIGDGIAKCPFDPEDNSTAVWVESGKLINLYSGIRILVFLKYKVSKFRNPTQGGFQMVIKSKIKYLIICC